MVTYTDWTRAVHTAFQQMGGQYDEDTAARITEIAAEFWQENKQELLEIAFDAAVALAKRALDV